MLVGDIMERTVITAAPGATMPEVLRLLDRRGVRHLPVVQDGALVGIISDRDVKAVMVSGLVGAGSGSGGAAPAARTAADIMTRNVITIGPMFTVEEAARIMVSERISALPVVHEGRLVGIATETDLLGVLIRAMGAAEPSSRLDVTLPGTSPAADDVLRTVEATGARISSVLTLTGADGRREIVIRVATIDPGPAVKALEDKGYTVRDSRRAPIAP
jgi:acetoin utilization protein AcuB